MVNASVLRIGCALLCASCQYVAGVDDLKIVETDWTCLSTTLPPPRGGLVNYEGVVRNLAGNTTLNDVVARLCPRDEGTCSSPLLTVSTTTAGTLGFTVDAAFDGYIELEGPGMMPAIVDLLKPIGSMRAHPEFRMIEPAVIEAYAKFLQSPIEPDLGHLLFWAQDCAARRASDVVIERVSELHEKSTSYYVESGLPNPQATQTDRSGGGGFVNLPPGYLTFYARRASDVAAFTTFAVQIRAGHVTFVVIEPD